MNMIFIWSMLGGFAGMTIVFMILFYLEKRRYGKIGKIRWW